MNGNILLLQEAVLLLLAVYFFSSLSAFAASVSPEKQSLQRSVRLLDRVRHNVTDEISQNVAKGDALAARENRQFIDFLTERIIVSCQQLYSLGAEEALADLPCPDQSKFIISPKTSVTTVTEEVQALDTVLSEALGDFDEMLLKEEERIAARSPRRSEGNSSGVGGGQDGAGADVQSNQQSGVASGANSDEKTASGQGQDGQMQNHKNTTTGNGNAAASSPGGEKPDRDEDIVARQLREAAEKETDPELKKKLWEEYRRYTSSH